MRSIRARTWSMSTAVAAVVDAFDHHTTEFRQLAEEWLEENHVRGRPRLEEAGRAVHVILELHHRGREKVAWIFSLTNAAYNLVRMRTLIRVGVCA